MNLASEINELLDRLSESHRTLNEIKNQYNLTEEQTKELKRLIDEKN